MLLRYPHFSLTLSLHIYTLLVYKACTITYSCFVNDLGIRTMNAFVAYYIQQRDDLIPIGIFSKHPLETKYYTVNNIFFLSQPGISFLFVSILNLRRSLGRNFKMLSIYHNTYSIYKNETLLITSCNKYISWMKFFRVFAFNIISKSIEIRAIPHLLPDAIVC